MTTLIPFQPVTKQGQPPFRFQATLDGNLYNVTVTWSLFGQRWYLDIIDQLGNLIVHLPLVGSSNGQSIEAMTWSVDDGGQVTVETAVPHGYKLGMAVVLSITNCNPSGYNVVSPCWITGPSEFIYPLAANPGASVVPGSFTYDINLVKGYFFSSMVYRILNGTIEIQP